MPLSLKHDHLNTLVRIVAETAAYSAGGPGNYFKDLVDRSDLPRQFQLQLAGGWTGNTTVDARKLLNFAITRDINPQDARYTTLGSILREVLEDVGLENYAIIVAMIVVYKLYRDGATLESLKMRYMVPDPAVTTGAPLEIGPAVEWRGPTDAVELQVFKQPVPDLLDVGFLKRALEATPSVCRIEHAEGGALGTGFLVAPGLVLTNYHVLSQRGPDIEKNATQLVLRFAAITSGETSEEKGRLFRLQADKPVLKSSPVGKLDYAFLQVEQTILQAEGIKCALFDISLPKHATGLNILQHPAGQTMKLALSSNGITGVYAEDGLIQYVTSTQGGSSGSPCFNNEWRVIALHHAERSKMFGTIREGILFGAIHAEIGAQLPP